MDNIAAFTAIIEEIIIISFRCMKHKQVLLNRIFKLSRFGANSCGKNNK
ncbi:hypothetical protein LCGC14_1343380 [marine sediment metagenome]|uniref:Uncharacterized protein n=1 Tax=marine sediment metagenome TaxID=412755 RepID=A0A0F9KD00_9ZZZZ